jgi:hypothetical protein
MLIIHPIQTFLIFAEHYPLDVYAGDYDISQSPRRLFVSGIFLRSDTFLKKFSFLGTNGSGCASNG